MNKHCKNTSSEHWLTCAKDHGLNGSNVCKELLMFPHQCSEFKYPKSGRRRNKNWKPRRREGVTNIGGNRDADNN